MTMQTETAEQGRPTREKLEAIVSEVAMAMTTLTPAESVQGVLTRHGVRLPQPPARPVSPADDGEPEHTAAQWKAAVERFLLTWAQAGNLLRADGYDAADDMLPELLAPLWEMTDLGDEHRPVQEHQLAKRHESAEVVASMLHGLAEALSNEGRSPR